MRHFIRTITTSLRYGLDSITRRKLYLGMFLVPIALTFFFTNLMKEGLPVRIPVAIVDLDQSALSRQMTRSLEASQMLSIEYTAENYHDALGRVRNGDIFGFFYIPSDFQAKTVAGRTPTVTFYSNMTYFVPGTLSFKGFKTVAVATNGGVAATTLTATGMVNEQQAKTLLQPVVVNSHPLGNPWLNYAVYLCNSFVPGALVLMILIMTAYSVGEEIKRHSSPAWLAASGGSMAVALFGKLVPQAVLWSAIGIMMQSVFYHYCGYPLNNHFAHMAAAMILLVIASQAFSLIICEILPNLRLALSINSLIGILSFSVTGFSFPVEQMYGSIGVFSYLIPLRWYFLIYIDQALNGIPIFYSRLYYVALLIFPLVPWIGLARLKKRCVNPVYVI